MTLVKKLLTMAFVSLAGMLLFQEAASASEDVLRTSLLLKSPGNPAVEYELTDDGGILSPTIGNLPLTVTRSFETGADFTRVELTVRADDTIYYNIGQRLSTGMRHADCLFYMPGFWYRKNLRSPESAPSFRTSDSWIVREDRLSTPLTGVYDEKTGEWCTVMRTDDFDCESLAAHSSGEIILGSETSIGFTGFCNAGSDVEITFGFPYREAPKTYLRKLRLAPPVTAFEKLGAGESKTFVWKIRKGRSASWSEFVASVWESSFESLRPLPVDTKYTEETAKAALSRYFESSFVGSHPLKYYSGTELRLRTAGATESPNLVLSGAKMLANAESVFESYLENGFTAGGLFKEKVDFNSGQECRIFSIRRQSEAVYAVLHYLRYEKASGRGHAGYERLVRKVLDRLTMLQNEDGSFPRKFDDDLSVIDPSGGSTSSAVLPFSMAYSFFGDKKYLETARRASSYIETHIIAPADYFSSTLDANCEDKEASLYASTAMYYMYLVEKSKKIREHYAQLCLKSAYFALSWYYLWDVPFAQGQMLGDVGFKSRGWGNVSVENNHIDVFIFEFADVLDFLAKKFDKPYFSEFTAVIRTSMLQLMPEKGKMFDIAAEGYYPEVVQHTNWDYGKNGKGFYNDIFAPGWTVASLWQMLSRGRTEKFFNN